MNDTDRSIFFNYDTLVSKISSSLSSKSQIKYGLLIGRNISFSLSDRIHSLIYHLLGIKNIEYLIYDTKEDSCNESWDIKKIISLLGKDNLIGASITTPYKTINYPNPSRLTVKLSDSFINLSLTNEKLYSVNTLYKYQSRICSTSTDLLGLEYSLKESGYREGLKSFTNIIILGSGGMSQAVVDYIKKHTTKTKICFILRSIPSFIDSTDRSLIGKGFYPLSSQSVEEILNLVSTSEQTLILNTLLKDVDTSWCFSPITKLNKLKKQRICFMDLNYKKDLNSILEEERSFFNLEGVSFIDGMDMLIAQAIYSEIIWNKLKISLKEFEDLLDNIKLRLV